MDELTELTEHARRNLAEAKARGDEFNTFFYSKVLELYQGETGSFWGLMLREIRKPEFFDREVNHEHKPT